MDNEPVARLDIDKQLIDSNWVLPNDKERKPNVDLEVSNKAGKADYVLYDSKGFPLCVIEAKNPAESPLIGKEQAKGYAEDLKCRFVILSNGIQHYQWDLEQGNPFIIEDFPTQEKLELRKEKFNPTVNVDEDIKDDYIVLSQDPQYSVHPNYRDESLREDFIARNKLKFLRSYQLDAIHAVQNAVKKGEERFLLEMATGTGKTLISAAIIKMFLRNFGVNKVLFLVDRLELEIQAKDSFDAALSNDYQTKIWKGAKDRWKSANIVISTVQSFTQKNKYKRIFRHDDFDLVISDEAHRSLGARSRKVFEYFNGFKLGLTATPKNFLRAIDTNKLSAKDPRQLEQRLALDTYTTFGCESGEPTFRYSLEQGVKDEWLINPKVIDARSEITTELLSEKGYFFEGIDDEGDEVEETFSKKDFEKKFFSVKTNESFCQAFLERAKKDPYTDEIGKTLIFCVSQSHATKITQILNLMADKMFPGQYNSDFAVQVTSKIKDSQDMAINFKNNNLSGESKSNPNYITSKTRVCVTVGMMTTGYDCEDILNICLMRPVYSPGEFVQMKGRGTRKYDFSGPWKDKKAIPKEVESLKTEFLFFDFMANFEYFEKDFNYDEKIELPQKSKKPDDDPTLDLDASEVTIDTADPIKSVKETELGPEGMKIDRELYPSFVEEIKKHSTLIEMVKNFEWEAAETYLVENVFDRPEEYYTLEKLRESLEIDRRLTIRELLLFALGFEHKIKLKDDLLIEEFEKFDDKFKLTEENFDSYKNFFNLYVVDEEFREIIASKKYADLNTHPAGQGAIDNIPNDAREQIISYIDENVVLERFMNA